MNRTLFFLVCIVSLAALAFWFLARGPVPLPVGGAGPEPSPRTAVAPASAVAAGPAEADGPRATAAAMDREKLRAPDADWQEALAGFRGRLIDSDKVPVADRLVRLYRVDQEVLDLRGPFAEEVADRPPIRIEEHEVRTDAAGCFLITGTFPRSMHVLEADADGESRRTQLVERTPGPGEIVDLGDIELPLLGSIIGRVVDESLQPVAGALVRAADIPSAMGMYLDMAHVEWFDPQGALIVRATSTPMVFEMPPLVAHYHEKLVRPQARTDADGRFRLAGVQPADNVVAITAVGLVPLLEKGVRVAPGKEKDMGRIRLREGEIARVRVVDSDDEPVVGAEILVAPQAMMVPVDMAFRPGRTGPGGMLDVSGIATTQISVAARRGPKHPWVVLPAAGVDQDAIVRLPGRHHLDLAIRSATGKDIVAPRFRLMQSAGREIPLEVALFGLVRWLDIDDDVERQEDGRYRIGELIPGEYSLAVTAPGHAVARLEFKIDKSTAAEVVLEPAASFVVRVLDSADQPVSQAKIYGRYRPEDRDLRVMEAPIVLGRTDAGGRLEVADGQAGGVHLSASHPRFGYAHADTELPAAEPIVLRMESPGLLTGVLTENGRQPTPGKWTIVFEYRGGAAGRVRGALDNIPRFAVPDLEGRFTQEGMEPGRYRLRVIESLAALNSPGGLIAFAMQAQMMRRPMTKDVVVDSGAPVHVELEAIREPETIVGPSGQVSGTILINGRPGKDYLVVVSGRHRSAVTADAAGRFDLGGLPVGEHDLLVRDPTISPMLDMRMQAKVWADKVKVVENESVVLDIRVDTASASGVVLGSGGTPAGNVRVEVRGGPGGANALAFGLSDPSGRFTFANLPLGTYDFLVRDRQQGFGQTTAEVSGSVAGVVVQLGRVYRAQGRVDVAALGSPKPEHVFLRFQAEATEVSEFTRVAEDGSFAAGGLPPGQYRIEIFAAGRSNAFEPIPLEIGNQDLEDLRVVPVAKPAEPAAAPVRRERRRR